MVPKVVSMLTRLALANTINRRMEFTSSDALEALADQPEQQALFARLVPTSPAAAAPSA